MWTFYDSSGRALQRIDTVSASPGATPSASAPGDTQAGGADTDYSRNDHRHAREAAGVVTGLLTLSGVISPAQLTANTDDWAPTGLSTAAIIRASTDASRNLTGLTGGASGRIIVLANVGANDLVLVHDATSTAANRFYCPNDSNLTLQKDSTAILEYDATSSRWRLIGGGGGGGAALTVEEVDGSPTDAAVTKLVFPNDSVSIAAHVATVRQVPYGFIGARAESAAGQTISSNAWTGLTFGSSTETTDTDAFHDTSTNTSRFTIPAGLGGKYLVGGSAAYSSAANNARGIAVYKNGSLFYGTSHFDPNTGVGEQYGATAAMLELVAGDYVEIVTYQLSGGNLTIPSQAYGKQAWLIKLDAGRVGSGIGCGITKGSNLALSTSGEAALTMDTENFDTDGFHDTSTNNNRVTIPIGLGGKYLINLHGRIDANQNAYLIGRKNGSAIVIFGSEVWNSTNSFGIATDSAVVDLAAGDYIEFKQVAAAAANLVPSSGQQSIVELIRVDSGGQALPITTVDGQMGADVAASASAMVDLVSITLNSGTWDIYGWAQVLTTGAATHMYVSITDSAGTTQYAKELDYKSTASAWYSMSILAAGLSLPSGGTIKLRGQIDVTGNFKGSTSLGTGGGCKLHAVKIA